MISTLKEASTEHTMAIPCVATFNQSITCWQIVFSSKPSNKRMFRDRMLEPKNSPPSYLLSLLSKDFTCGSSGVFPRFVESQRTLSSCLISTRNSWLWMPTKSSDLAGFHFQLWSINTFSSLASKLLAASYMVLQPYFWYSSDFSGCNLPTNVSFFKAHELFFPWILSSNGWQSLSVNFPISNRQRPLFKLQD